MNSNKKTLTAILILLVMCTGISISYAFFKVASSNNNANTNVTINGAALCMSLQLSSDNITISNEYAVPISDKKALSSDTYKTSVTITNNCNTSQSFNLLLVPNGSNTMPIKALKYALVEEGVTPTTGRLISNEYLLDSTIQKQLLAIKNETLKNGFSVGSGTVSSGTKTYNLYLWIDKDEGSLGNGSTMNKSLNAYLTLGSGTNTFDMRLYQTISNKYENGDEHVKLYNPTEYGDNTTYDNSIYYYHGAAQNNNLLFGGFCWKIVRTTETGGVKIVYNGVQKDGSCNNTGTDSQIGRSAFNSSANSPAYVGYMYNTVYTYSFKNLSSESSIVLGNSFTYTNGTYTLNNTKTINNWSNEYNTINNTHYTCFNSSTTCESIYYVLLAINNAAYYISLTGGKSVDDALNEMLYADDVNKYDSTVKAYIDNWYKNNLKNYEEKLEDTVFCNNRTIKSKGFFDTNGSVTTGTNVSVDFNTYNYSLACANETDRFSMKNVKAKLIYPIAMLSLSEVMLANKDVDVKDSYLNGNDFWTISPNSASIYQPYNLIKALWNDSISSQDSTIPFGVKPAVSLKPNIEYVSGDGSYTSPFVIE